MIRYKVECKTGVKNILSHVKLEIIKMTGENMSNRWRKSGTSRSPYIITLQEEETPVDHIKYGNEPGTG
jgi:hypothetical protein